MALTIDMARALTLEAAVAAAHNDIEGNDKAAARRHGVNRSTVYRWRQGHRHGPLYRAGEYLIRCADPWRAWTSVQISMRWSLLLFKKTPELVERWRALSTQRAADQSRETALLEEAALELTVPSELLNLRERLAAALVEIVAIGRELESRKVNPLTYREGER